MMIKKGFVPRIVDPRIRRAFPALDSTEESLAAPNEANRRRRIPTAPNEAKTGYSGKDVMM
jgi:hypothetical protein